MYFILLLIVSISVVFSQYNINQKDLIYTTFTREYKSSVLNKYLKSNNDKDIIAALLSISHTEDQTYIPEIINLNYQKFGKYINFALGHLKKNNTSIKFLLEKIKLDNDPYRYDSMVSFGRIASGKDINELIKIKKNNPNLKNFVYALLAFRLKNELTISDTIKEIFLDDLFSNDDELIYEALYAIRRLFKSNVINKKIYKFIINNRNDFSAKTLILALSVLNRARLDESSFNFLKSLTNHEDFRVRIELSKAFSKYPFKNRIELSSFLILLHDKNPNVRVTVSKSIKNIKSNIFSEKQLVSLLDDDELSKNIKGNILYSFANSNDADIKVLYEKYSPNISEAFRIKMISIANNKWAFDQLLKMKKNIASKNIIVLQKSIINLQKELIRNKEFKLYILNSLKDKNTTISECTSAYLSKEFINKYKDDIEDIIIDRIKKKKDDAAYRTALKEFKNIATKISEKFYKEYLNELRNSKNDDILHFISIEKGNRATIKANDMFDVFWKKAFKYKNATVKTSRGTFTFKLKNEFSPISVGNFIYLCELNYFNNMRFHRVVPNFLAQIGDKTGTGWGKVNYTINTELSPSKFDENYIGMASAGRNTESSHWFIMHNRSPHLYGKRLLTWGVD